MHIRILGGPDRSFQFQTNIIQSWSNCDVIYQLVYSIIENICFCVHHSTQQSSPTLHCLLSVEGSPDTIKGSENSIVITKTMEWMLWFQFRLPLMNIKHLCNHSSFAYLQPCRIITLGSKLFSIEKRKRLYSGHQHPFTCTVLKNFYGKPWVWRSLKCRLALTVIINEWLATTHM